MQQEQKVLDRSEKCRCGQSTAKLKTSKYCITTIAVASRKDFELALAKHLLLQGLTIFLMLTKSLEVIWQSSSNMLLPLRLQPDPTSKAAKSYNVREK